MRKAAFVIAAALALTALSGRGAAAAEFCAYSGGAKGGGYENCGFHTWEQCLANISGMGATACATRTIRPRGDIAARVASTTARA